MQKILPPRIYAHKTSAGLFPENTLYGFHQSLLLGFDVIDMDICMTQDHHLVLSHDPYLNKDFTKDSKENFLQKKNLLIKDLTLDKLKQFTVGERNLFLNPQKNHPYQQNISSEKIPTLDEIFSLGKSLSNQISYQIEIKYEEKNADLYFSIEKLTTSLLALITKHNLLSFIEIQSFDWNLLALLKKLEPNCKTAFLSPSNQAPFFTSALLKKILKFQGNIWGPKYSHLSHKKVKKAHALGLKVVPWTVNDIDDMEKMIKWEVDGIITDRPDQLKLILDKQRFLFN